MPLPLPLPCLCLCPCPQVPRTTGTDLAISNPTAAGVGGAGLADCTEGIQKYCQVQLEDPFNCLTARAPDSPDWVLSTLFCRALAASLPLQGPCPLCVPVSVPVLTPSPPSHSPLTVPSCASHPIASHWIPTCPAPQSTPTHVHAHAHSMSPAGPLLYA